MRSIATFFLLCAVVLLSGVSLTSAKAISREETLVLMHGGSQGQWTDVGIANPYATGFSHQQGNAAWLEPLFYYSAFSGKTIPWLAESYHYNKNFTELTITLRKDVYWSDGHHFSAKDVAFTFNMLKKHAPLLRNSAEIQEWLTSVDAIDDVTVKFVFVSPKPQFHFSHLSFKFDSGVYIVPEHIFNTVADPSSFSFYDPQKGWPVVTGGYQVTEWSPQKKVLDYRENWWAVQAGLAKKPHVTRILFIPFSDESRAVQMIINNQIDMSIDLRPTTIKQAVAQNEKIITHTLRTSPYGYVDWWPISLWFNCSEAPFDNKSVRWAISYAIDRRQLIDVAYEGAGVATQLPFPDYPGLKPFIDSTKELLEKYPTNEFDKEKSARLMSQEGYTKDDKGFWEKNGKRITMTIYGFSIFDDFAPLLAEQLRRSGFEATYTAPADSYSKITTGIAGTMIFGHGGSIADPHATLDFFTSKNALPNGQPTQFFSRWKNKEFDNIVDEMGMLPAGKGKSKELYLQAMKIWLDELPNVPLMQWMHRIPMNTTYWKGYPTEKNSYVNGAFWHLTFPLMLQELQPGKEGS